MPESLLRLPARLGHDSADHVARCVGALASSSAPMHVDGSPVKFALPFGVAAIEAALALRRLRGLPAPSWTPPQDSDANAFLGEVDFSLAPTRTDETVNRRGGPLDVHVQHLRAADVVFVQKAGDLIRRRVPGTPSSIAHDIKLALNELTTNVFEHARSPVGCVAQTRWYAKDSNVRIAVADVGVGIARHLRQHARFARESSEDLVRRALVEEGVSGRTSGKFGGLGLKHLANLARSRGGALRVMTSGVLAEVTEAGVRTTLLAHDVLGTFVELDFRPSQEPDDDGPQLDDEGFF